MWITRANLHAEKHYLLFKSKPIKTPCEPSRFGETYHWKSPVFGESVCDVFGDICYQLPEEIKGMSYEDCIEVKLVTVNHE